MKKVLIICDLFPPAFGPRMGYLCKYIREQGWEPTVLAEWVEDEKAFSFLAGEANVRYVNFYTANSKSARKRQWMFTFTRDMLYGYKDKRMYHEAKKILKGEKFDLILCSSFRTFPLPAAGKLSRKFRLPLVVDLRDIIEQYTGNEYISHSLPSLGGLEKSFAAWFTRKSLRQRNRVLQSAAYLTTVSPWHVDILKRYNPKVELIYNGYDPELFFPEQINTHHFVITYTGRLLSTAMRDPSLFFEALSMLIKDKTIHPADCHVNWYVDEASWMVITKEAEKYNILSYSHFKGYVPAAKIPHVLNSSSILLLLTNQSFDNGPKGVMTTKFFESLAVEKPILCVRSDESYLAQAIEETHAGLAAIRVDEVYDFLKEQYLFWKANGYTASNIDRKTLQRYSRPEQAAQFASIFNELTTLPTQKDPIKQD